MKKQINFIVKNARVAIHFLDLCIHIVIYATIVIMEILIDTNIVNIVKNAIEVNISIALNVILVMKVNLIIPSIVKSAKHVI